MGLALAVALLLTAEPPSPTSQARELGQAAQKLYKQGKFLEAIEKYQAAYALKPHPAVHFNIAKCREALGEPGKALSEYREYLRLMPEASDRDAVQTSMTGLQKQLAQKGVQQLSVVATPATAVVEIDGRPLGLSPVYVELPAGAHTVVVSAADFERVERPVTLTLDRMESVTVDLKPKTDAPKVASNEPATTVAPEPPPPPPNPPLEVAATPAPTAASGHRVWTWVALGVGAASAAAAIGCGVGANSAAAELHSVMHVTADGDVLVARASSFALAADVTWGIAAAAAIVAVIAFFVEGRP
jgi:tetratricopeptide (TPR) repeat protein